MADARYIKQITRHYPRKDEVASHVIPVLDQYTTLHPEQNDFNYDDGRVELLLCITGVIPVAVRGVTYNCPLAVWLPLDYPTKPPIVLIVPTSTMQIKPGNHVDRNGNVTLPYLSDWAKKNEGCSLIPLMELLTTLFGRDYPLVSIAAQLPKPTPPLPQQPTPPVSRGSPVPAARPGPPPRPPPPGDFQRGPGAINMHIRSDSVGSGSDAGGGGFQPPRPPMPPGGPQGGYGHMPGYRSYTAAPIGPSAADAASEALARDFPDVAKMSREEMTALLEDEAYFDAYFNTMPQALKIHETYEKKVQDNIALAEKNESMRPALEALRTETGSLFAEANDLKSRWAYIEAAQADMFKRFTPGVQLNRLRSATSGQEHLSESLVSSFLDGQMDEESFSRQYKEIRKVYHRRAVSLEKWEEGKVVWRT